MRAFVSGSFGYAFWLQLLRGLTGHNGLPMHVHDQTYAQYRSEGENAATPRFAQVADEIPGRHDGCASATRHRTPTLPRLNNRVGSHRRDSLFDISACDPWARVILGLGCDPFRRHATSGIFALSSWPFFPGRAVEIPRGASAAIFLRFRFRVWSRHHPSQLTPAVCCSVSLSSLL